MGGSVQCPDLQSSFASFYEIECDRHLSMNPQPLLSFIARCSTAPISIAGIVATILTEIEISASVLQFSYLNM